ncbi:hypothetical protein DFH07DRAFT_873889 [Mycena maculata]|uniref:NUC153 domain-containing protein n=1 Tax=Mycena maculata TaxID=230809 RepID=A0AAD7P1C5_9AGAR|nr:hypothetical protein DFH07DRAFT_873889 [Mycena maculata]
MDSRFARLRSDPRFRRPRKDKAKVVVDERFKALFAPKIKKGRVDKYGRPISETHEHENLRRFYRLENEDDPIPPPLPDYARGQALLESSDEEEEDSASDGDGDSNTAGHQSTRPINLTGTDPDAEIDLDEDNFADLDAQAAEYAKSHPDDGPTEGSQTHRLAAVNLDWDHVRAAHLFKICASLVSPTASSAILPPAKISSDHALKGGPSRVVRGKILSVRVYPSEFGKERLAREEKEGPPPEIFKKPLALDEDEVNEKSIYQVGDENDYDEDALRKYQLERLRYYYAIITCDSTEAAAHIYSELEGTELERSANIFDLSFVPEDMTFDQECREEATEDANTSHKGVDFVTDALRHSKVKLTWDEDDPERNQITRRTLTRKEIEEADFRAYLASSSDDDLEDEKDTGKESKSQDASRDRLRSLLLAGGDELPEGWDRGQEDDEGDVDMQITFTPGLTDSKAPKDETTLDKYQRKMKEKRKKKKVEVKAIDEGAEADEFFDEEDGPASTKKPIQRPANKPSRSLSTAEELTLLVSSDNPTSEPRHFDMKAILKAEKQAKRKGRKRQKAGEDDANEIQEDFAINVADARFTVLHDDHAFAIDPSNPHFKKTKGMNALLEERSKRQRQRRDGAESSAKQSSGDGTRSLQNLVDSVKRKSSTVDTGSGKRRKLQD